MTSTDDRNAPANKGDLLDLKEKIDQKVDQLFSEVNHGYADILGRTGDSETRLLKAFYDFALSNRNERRLNMPPAA